MFLLKNLLTFSVVSKIAFYIKIRTLHTLFQSISSFSRGLAKVFKFGGDERSHAEPMWDQTKKGIYRTEFLSSVSQPPPSHLTNLMNSVRSDTFEKVCASFLHRLLCNVAFHFHLKLSSWNNNLSRATKLTIFTQN